MDALVIFGATGDLAKLETFPALVGLVERGVLRRPGHRGRQERLGARAVPRLRRGVAYATTASTRTARRSEDARRCCGTSTVTSTTPRPTRRCPTRSAREARRALYYLEVPPPLFGRIAQGIAAAGRAEGARVMVEKPFGTDLAERPGAQRHDARGVPRGRRLPGGPLARPGPAGERAVRPVRQLHLRAAAQPHPRRERPDHDGRGVRRRRPGQLLRPHRRDPRRRAEPHAAGARQRARRPAVRDSGRPRGGRRSPAVIERACGRWTRSTPWCAASTTATSTSPGSHPGPPPSRTSPCGTACDSWRWADVPILIRAGKCMPVTATEISFRFRQPAARHSSGCGTRSATNRLRFRIWPESEVGLTLVGKKPGAGWDPQVEDLVVRQQALGRHAPLRPADRRRARRRAVAVRPPGDGRGGLAGGRARARTTRRPCTPTPRGSWGPKEADALLPEGRRLARPGRLTRLWSRAMDTRTRPQVVIVGGGFAGLFAARALRRVRRRRDPRGPRRAPPLPAAALPVRDGDPLRGADRGAVA